jgi:predicted O-methyltransferase YrrM
MGMGFPKGIVPTPPGVKVWPTPIFETIAAALIAWYLWRQGGKATRGPRAAGEVLALYLILMGLERFLVEFIRNNPRIIFGMSNAQTAALLSVIVGVGMLAVVRRRFRRLKGEHRILLHQAERGDVLQAEYHRATPECPQPERWRMYDSMTAEYEVLQFLKTLVTTLKPQLVVETGTFSAVSTLWIAEALKENGFGKILSCEYDAKVYARAAERIAKSGLSDWIELRNESSLEMTVNGEIDIFFSDSDPPLREREVRRFLPQIKPTGVILMHDASSHMKTVREAALKLEQEGLISAVLLSTPRGLVLGQRRAGRA